MKENNIEKQGCRSAENEEQVICEAYAYCPRVEDCDHGKYHIWQLGCEYKCCVTAGSQGCQKVGAIHELPLQEECDEIA